MVLLAPWAANAQSTVTVCDGTTTNANIPVYGYSADTQGTTSEWVIPASTTGLSDMDGQAITAMKFYVSTSAAAAWTATFQVYMKEIGETTISNTTGPGSCTVVYTGSLDATGTEMNVVFDDNYIYHGGNLLIGTYVSIKGNYKSASFYGIEATGAAYQSAGFNNNGAKDFLPKTTFTYEEPATCLKPTGLAAALTTPGDGTVATLSWTKGGDETNWVLQYGTDSEFNIYETYDGGFTDEGSTISANLMMLTPENTYYARVKADCGGGDESDWSTICSYQPTNKITIGSGDATDYTLPTYTNYHFSLTQQIYTVAELGAAGYIESIDIYCVSNPTTRDMDIYMVNTDKDSFSSGSDWITVTDGDIVFSGSVTFTANAWKTITLDAGFNYDGNHNVAIIIDDNTGDYENSAATYRVFNATDQAIYVYNDNTNYDPTNPGSYSGTKTSVKNQIRILKGEAPSCLKPSGVTVTYTGGTTATVSWASDAAAWNMKLNGVAVAGTITNPYTLTGLELATNYEVSVQADCGETQSDWTSAVNFTTDLCLPEDMCEIYYSLTDEYDDSWNGASINVVDVLTGANIASFTMPDVDGPYEDSFSVCDGREIRFEWIKGNYPSECGFVITDINGEKIINCAIGDAPTSNGTLTTYTVNCTVTTCKNLQTWLNQRFLDTAQN